MINALLFVALCFFGGLFIALIIGRDGYTILWLQKFFYLALFGVLLLLFLLFGRWILLCFI